MTERRRDLYGRHRLSVGPANVAMTRRGTDVFGECLVDEMARVGWCPERDVTAVPPVPRSQDATFSWEARNDLVVQNVPELSADVREQLGCRNEPVRFAQHVSRPLRDVTHVLRWP